jgi:hypothetical protein
MKPLTFKDWRDKNSYRLIDEYKDTLLVVADLPSEFVIDRYSEYVASHLEVDDDYLYEMHRDLAIENKIDELHEEMIDLIESEEVVK